MPQLYPPDRMFRSQTLRVADLAVVGDAVEDARFENCELVGPAIIVPIDGTLFNNCDFEGPSDGIFWPFPSTRQLLIGAIAFKSCKLYGCRITRIGIAVPQQDLPGLLTQFDSG